MAFDTPARIAIIGTGPIGLEAALYARCLGYDVDIYERGYVAECVRRWGHARLFAPFQSLSSSLGRAAIATQDPGWQPPAPGELLTGDEWVARYLMPLSQTDLLAPNLYEQHEVLAVGHEELLRADIPQSEIRGDYDFQLLLRNSAGHERWASADIVIDATGVSGTPNYLGPGGLPAAGELRARSRFEYGLPDVLGRDRPLYAGKRVLLVGTDHAAALTLLALEQLAVAEPATHCVWIMPAPFAADENDSVEHAESEAQTAQPAADPIAPPFTRIEQDPFPARDAVRAGANRLALHPPDWLTRTGRSQVRSIRWDSVSGRFVVTISDEVATEIEVERVIASVGHRPDYSLSQALPIEFDPVWEAPARMGRALSNTIFDLRRDPTATAAQVVLTSEPNFYVLGAKSYGRHQGFLYTAGLEQVRALFSIVGERADLDLYATAPRFEN